MTNLGVRTERDGRGRCWFWIAGLLTALALSAGTAAAGTGLLQGRVRTVADDVPVQGATVAVVGTSVSVVTDEEGDFRLPIVMTGLHRVLVGAAGYRERLVEDVAVWPDLTTVLAIRLAPETEPADAGAEPPVRISHSNGPGTTRLVSDRAMRRLPARGVLYVATLLPGVAGIRSDLLRDGTSDQALSIRGGSPVETAWSVDGQPQSQAAMMPLRAPFPTAALGAVAVTSSGFGAEYGGASSGIVHVLTREPGPSYRASANVTTDAGVGSWIGSKRYDQNRYEASIEGPLSAGSERGGFLFSGSRRWNGDRLPRFVAGNLIDWFRGSPDLNFDGGRQPENSLSGWNWLGRMYWRPANPVRMDIRVQGSRDDWREFTQAYLFDPGHMPRHADRTGGGDATLHVMRGSGTLFNLSAGYAISDQRNGDGVFFDDLRAYANPAGNPRFDISVPYFYLPGHVRGFYQRRKSTTWRLEGGLVQQWGTAHQLKAGLQAERGSLRLYEGDPTTFVYDAGGALIGGLYDGYGFDAFARGESGQGLGPARHPTTLSAYAQDRIAWPRLVMRGGLRLDSFDADTVDLPNPSGAFRNGASGRATRLSPRLDATWTAGPRLVLRAGAGRFYQPPPYLLDPFGSPLQRSSAVEVGAVGRPREGLRLDACVYLREVQNFVDVAPPRAEQSSRPVRSVSFNVGDASFKGLEVQASLEAGHRRAAWVGYTMSSSQGEFVSNSQRNIAWTGTSAPRVSRPLSSNQRHRLALGADLGFDRGGGPRLFGRRLLEMTSFRVVLRAASGLPYTPTFVYDEVTLAAAAFIPSGPIHSRETPWTSTVDLRAGRGFQVGGLDLEASLSVLNLLDRRNAVVVYSGTGSPYDTGFLATADGQAYLSYAASQGIDGEAMYRLAQSRPPLFTGPRLVRFGLGVTF